jgi:hypothetical protein
LQGTLDKLSSNLKSDFTTQEKNIREAVKGENGNLMKELQKVLEALRAVPAGRMNNEHGGGRGNGGRL